MSIAVVTSCYGGYDEIVAPSPQSVECEWIAVTDGEVAVPPPWVNIVEPRPHMHPRLAAKVAKCRPDLYTSATTTIWLDAAARIGPTSVERLAGAVSLGAFGQFVHPDRRKISDEADVSATMDKYQGQPVREQVAHYLKGGHPDDFGLWATGCIVRNTGDYRSVHSSFGDAWLIEQMRWTYQDQLSHPWLVNMHSLLIVPLPGPLWGNDLVSWSGHRRDD